VTALSSLPKLLERHSVRVGHNAPVPGRTFFAGQPLASARIDIGRLDLSTAEKRMSARILFNLAD
jgi:hypothetical protein